MMIELVASSAWMSEGAAAPETAPGGRAPTPGAPAAPAATAESMPRSTSTSFRASACLR